MSAACGADIHIGVLPGGLLGETFQNTITIDQNAQGHGWYTDVSAASITAFRPSVGNEWLAPRPAQRSATSIF